MLQLWGILLGEHMFRNKVFSVIFAFAMLLTTSTIISGSTASAQDFTGMESVALLDAVDKEHPVRTNGGSSHTRKYVGMESTALLDAVNKNYQAPRNAAAPRGNYGGLESTALLDSVNRDYSRGVRRSANSSTQAYGQLSGNANVYIQ